MDDWFADNVRKTFPGGEAGELAEELDVEPDTTPEAEIDPERLEKLRALGYVE